MKHVRTVLMAGVAMSIMAVSGNAHAQVLTSDVKTQLNTDLSYLEAAKQYLMQGEQYYQQGEQYYMQGEQFAQELQNAQGLENMLGLSGFNLDNYQSFNNGVMELNPLYSIDPFENFVSRARSLLSDSYYLPGTGNSAQYQIGSIFGMSSASPSDGGYDRMNRDTNQVMQYSNALTAVDRERQDTAALMQDQDERANDLTDNDLGAATQQLVVQSSTQMHQNDMALRLQQVTADNELQTKIERLEMENTIAEKNLQSLQRVQAFTESSQ